MNRGQLTKHGLSNNVGVAYCEKVTREKVAVRINSEYIELQRELAQIRERIKQTQVSLDRSRDPALKTDFTIMLTMFRRLERNTADRMESCELPSRIEECRKRIDSPKKLIDLMAANKTPSARLLRSLEGQRRLWRNESK